MLVLLRDKIKIDFLNQFFELSLFFDFFDF